MSSAQARRATRRLTHTGLELSPRRGLGRWFGRAAIGLAGLLVGAAGASGYWLTRPDASRQQAEREQALQQTIEQGRATLRVAEARGQELERELAAQIQKLRESQEELSFFRKARDTKR